ncbi:uncharacterized protein K460DRAFT_288132 [Cucurbitaria berberidis CBS 394.84]|uniref:Uncharacterized protein n=1 Tax=Cucurbitaria berberidis CBS 394.84 TaxID=1168544 RepID=A0A9P4GD73_9PLEO|nr:uncharacterized protein K460DRAFT_288132 [Cucurbitaria berberidis CBS 394.84]KAF1843753.1 hypothetical protein K460DRAFT_288132 [Cucurbitaria berberidis CBS 394.84]
MEPEALQWLGWHYASRIYERLKATDNLTFSAWSIFQKAFPKQIDHYHQFHVSEREAWSLIPTQLPSMVDRLAKLDTGMLTFLCIRNFSLTVDHLIALTKIHTLAGLVLEHKNSPMDRYMPAINISHWARAVCENRAFRKLRLLVVGNFGLGRNAVLQGVSSFSALTLVGVHQAGEAGGKPLDSYGDWRTGSPQWLKEKIAAPDEQSPMSIWVNPKITKAHKMKLLYNLCIEHLQQPLITENPQSSISVTYVCSEWFTQDDSIAWFFREFKEGKTQPTKRHKDQDQHDEKNPDSNKKRKIRQVKKMDVGSLLNTFS